MLATILNKCDLQRTYRLLSEFELNARPPGAAICLRRQTTWPKRLTGRNRASAGATCAVGSFYWYYWCWCWCCGTLYSTLHVKISATFKPTRKTGHANRKQTPYALYLWVGFVRHEPSKEVTVYLIVTAVAAAECRQHCPAPVRT